MWLIFFTWPRYWQDEWSVKISEWETEGKSAFYRLFGQIFHFFQFFKFLDQFLGNFGHFQTSSYIYSESASKNDPSSLVLCPFSKIVEKKISGSRAVKPDYGHFENFFGPCSHFCPVSDNFIYIYIRYLESARRDLSDKLIKWSLIFWPIFVVTP